MTKPVITVETARRIVFLTDEINLTHNKLCALNDAEHLGRLEGKLVVTNTFRRYEVETLYDYDISTMVIGKVREHYQFKLRGLIHQLEDLGGQSPIGTPDWL